MLQIHVDGLGEPNLNPADFRPSPEILSQRSAPGNGGPVRFGLGIHPGGRPASGTITPVIIHASLAADGSLLEAEVLTPVDAALAHLEKVQLPTTASSEFDLIPSVSGQAPEFVRNVLGQIAAGHGDLLPVSALPAGGARAGTSG